MSTHFLHKRAPAPQIPSPPPKPNPKPKPTAVEPPPKPKPTTTSSVVLPSPITTSTTASITRPIATPITTLSSTSSALPLVTQPSKSGSDGKSNTGLIAGAVAGALAVVIIAAGLVFLRRRKRINQELKEAELYQQQRVMRQNDDNNESSTIYGFGGRYRGGEDVEGGNEYQLKQAAKVQRQPSWWSRKKPLEYYQQVPPRDYLQRTKQQRQDKDMGQSGSEETTVDRSVYSSGHGVGHRVHDSIPEESLEPLQSDQKVQHHSGNYPSRQNTQGLRLNAGAFSTKPPRARREYSPSRPISSIEPISPIGSVFEESTILPYSPQRDVVHSLPSTSNNRSRARSSIPYPPPPPVLTSLTSSVTPAPLSRNDGKGTSYRPPTGFYDFGGSDEETNRPNGQFTTGYQPHQESQQIQQQRHQQQPPPSGGVLPPPIPRATRPKSISIVKPKPRSNTNPGPGIPIPLSPTSPISPTGSEPGSGPKVGGRRARVKSRNKGIPNVSP